MACLTRMRTLRSRGQLGVWPGGHQRNADRASPVEGVQSAIPHRTPPPGSAGLVPRSRPADGIRQSLTWKAVLATLRQRLFLLQDPSSAVQSAPPPVHIGVGPRVNVAWFALLTRTYWA